MIAPCRLDEPRPVVGVIARLPRPGRTKTRLAREVGPDAAADLHEAFVRDEMNALAHAGFDVVLLHDAPGPGEEPVVARLRGGAAGIALPGADLGGDLDEAFRRLCRDGRPVVVVASDVPHVDPDAVREALARLREADVVFGPSPDGGYWLVGMRRAHALFAGIAMGTSVALAQTWTRAASLGLTVAWARPARDVDTGGDLREILPRLPAGSRTSLAAARAGLDGARAPLPSPPLPRRLHLELTNRCNLDCRACARGSLAESAMDLAPLDVMRLLADLPDLRTVALQVNGESLVYPWLGDVVRAAHARGAAVEMNTSAVLLDERRRRTLIETGLEALHVSLDGATPETYRAVRGADEFEAIVARVRALVRERDAAGAHCPRVALWIIATRRTLRELPALVRLCADVGADEVYVQRLVVFGRGLATDGESLHGRVGEQESAILSEAAALAGRLGVVLGASGGRDPARMLAPAPAPEPWRECRRPFESAVVMADGDVVPCCISTFVAPRAEIRLGSVLQDGWNAVWWNERYRRLRAGLAGAAPPPLFCRGCGVRWSL